MFAVYVVLWISLEGSLPRVLVMAVGTTLLTAAFLLQRSFGGQLPFARPLVGCGGRLGRADGAELWLAGLAVHGREDRPACARAGVHADRDRVGHKPFALMDGIWLSGRIGAGYAGAGHRS